MCALRAVRLHMRMRWVYAVVICINESLGFIWIICALLIYCVLHSLGRVVPIAALRGTFLRLVETHSTAAARRARVLARVVLLRAARGRTSARLCGLRIHSSLAGITVSSGGRTIKEQISKCCIVIRVDWVLTKNVIESNCGNI